MMSISDHLIVYKSWWHVVTLLWYLLFESEPTSHCKKIANDTNMNLVPFRCTNIKENAFGLILNRSIVLMYRHPRTCSVMVGQLMLVRTVVARVDPRQVLVLSYRRFGGSGLRAEIRISKRMLWMILSTLWSDPID